jgi:hypothetical protein
MPVGTRALKKSLLREFGHNENGGFITHYLPDGMPTDDTNSETTAIVLIAFS